MVKCANEECPNNQYQPAGLRHHWVQLQEIDVEGPVEHPQTRHVFAAVACSTRCAAVVLLAKLEPEDAERVRRGERFPDRWKADF